MNQFKDNLLETRNRLLNEIRPFRIDEFNKKPDQNNWSAAQVCDHLILVEIAFTKAIVYGLNKEDQEIERKDLSFMMDRKQKIPAPEIVIPNSEPIEVQQVIDRLSESRKDLLAVLSTIKDRSILKGKYARHPIFGKIPLDQWIELLYVHERRHIEQIREIKGIIGVEK
jgi:Mg2+ and Co2+ transporter CorA